MKNGRLAGSDGRAVATDPRPGLPFQGFTPAPTPLRRSSVPIDRCGGFGEDLAHGPGRQVHAAVRFHVPGHRDSPPAGCPVRNAHGGWRPRRQYRSANFGATMRFVPSPRSPRAAPARHTKKRRAAQGRPPHGFGPVGSGFHRRSPARDRRIAIFSTRRTRPRGLPRGHWHRTGRQRRWVYSAASG